MKHTSSLILLGALVACGGTDEAGRQSEEASRAATVLELTGCVGVSPDAGEVALRQVQYADEESEKAGASVPGITENAWVRLEGHEIATMLGEHVHVRGEVIDSGENTIGTAGVKGYETPSGDTSQADSDQHHAEKLKREAGRIARESMANGTSAKLRVLSVERTGTRSCEAPPGAPQADRK